MALCFLNHLPPNKYYSYKLLSILDLHDIEKPMNINQICQYKIEVVSECEAKSIYPYLLFHWDDLKVRSSNKLVLDPLLAFNLPPSLTLYYLEPFFHSQLYYLDMKHHETQQPINHMFLSFKAIYHLLHQIFLKLSIHIFYT